VRTVLATCLLLLAACLYLSGEVVMAPRALLFTYGAYLLLVGVVLVTLVARYSRYGYRGLVRSERDASAIV